MRTVVSLACLTFLTVAAATPARLFSRIGHEASEALLSGPARRNTHFTTLRSKVSTAYVDLFTKRSAARATSVRSIAKPLHILSASGTKKNLLITTLVNTKFFKAPRGEKEDWRVALRAGLTFDPCTSDSDCQGDRKCVQSGGVACTGTTNCVCLPPDPISCTTSEVCPPGEVCAIVGDSGTFCVSEEQTTPVPPSTRPPTTGGSGLTFDPCTSDSDCQGDRKCLQSGGVACTGTTNCVCVPPDPISCTNSDVCPPGEVCAIVGDAGTFCVSEEQTTPVPPPTDPPTTDPPTTDPPTTDPTSTDPPSTDPPSTDPPSTGGDGNGLTFDPCTSDSDCQGDRECLQLGGREACTGTTDCVCVPPTLIRCVNSDVCPPGEVCAIVGDSGTFCVSEEQTVPVPPSTDSPTTTAPAITGGTDPPTTTAPGGGQLSPPSDTSGSDDNDAVCIDARALGHMNKEELVFEEHSMAAVLCDSNESCATPGHIVHFNGKAMMMKTYCEIAGCEKRSMLVNSPRYRKAIRVSSNTEGLEYTAFAARYSTRAEEVLLTSAVRLGF